VASGFVLDLAWQFDEMGLGVEHGLVLPLQAGLDEAVNGLPGQHFPGVPEDGAVAGLQPLVQHPGFQAATVRKPTVRVRQRQDVPKK
jgi:hypothetical protein